MAEERKFVLINFICAEHGILFYDILCSDMFKAIAWTDKEQEVIADIRQMLSRCIDEEDRVK